MGPYKRDRTGRDLFGGFDYDKPHSRQPVGLLRIVYGASEGVDCAGTEKFLFKL